MSTTVDGTFIDQPTMRLRTGGDSHGALTNYRTATKDRVQASFMAKERGKVIHIVLGCHRAGTPFAIQAVVAMVEQKGGSKAGDA